MKVKKFIMVILLIVIIIGIAIFFMNTNKTKKIGKENNETSTATRVETEKIKTSNIEQKEEINNTVILKDNYFITQLNDIYYNPDEYIGKKIEIEGFSMSNDGYTFIGRYGPGCCTGDQYAYIEYEYSKDLNLVDEQDWIKVKGTIEQGNDGKATYTYIKATSVQKLMARGKDTVIN